MNTYSLPVTQMRAIAETHNRHFFDASAMRFFSSRCGECDSLGYFITSEQFDQTRPRLYTIRHFDRTTGEVETISQFQEFETRASAKRSLKTIIQAN